MLRLQRLNDSEIVGVDRRPKLLVEDCLDHVESPLTGNPGEISAADALTSKTVGWPHIGLSYDA